MILHLRLYTCDKCHRSTGIWVPLPAPDKVTYKGGGCATCTTPAPNFTRWEAK